jgi:hypothetical protein
MAISVPLDLGLASLVFQLSSTFHNFAKSFDGQLLTNATPIYVLKQGSFFRLHAAKKSFLATENGICIDNLLDKVS